MLQNINTSLTIERSVASKMCGLIRLFCFDISKALILDTAIEDGDQLKWIWRAAVMIMSKLENMTSRERVTRTCWALGEKNEEGTDTRLLQRVFHVHQRTKSLNSSKEHTSRALKSLWMIRRVKRFHQCVWGYCAVSVFEGLKYNNLRP